MKKQELIDLIVMANDAEEQMISNLASHLDASLEWFKGTDEEREKLRAGLLQLRHESETHAHLLDSLKKHVMKKGKDVY